MPPQRLVWRPVYPFVLIVLLIAFNVAAKVESSAPQTARLSVPEIEDALQVEIA